MWSEQQSSPVAVVDIGSGTSTEAENGGCLLPGGDLTTSRQATNRASLRFCSDTTFFLFTTVNPTSYPATTCPHASRTMPLENLNVLPTPKAAVFASGSSNAAVVCSTSLLSEGQTLNRETKKLIFVSASAEDAAVLFKTAVK